MAWGLGTDANEAAANALQQAQQEQLAAALIEQMVRRSNVLPFSSAKTG